MNEDLLVGPALLKAGTTTISVVTRMFRTFLKIKGQIFTIKGPGPYTLSSLRAAVKKRFKFDDASSSYKSISGKIVQDDNLLEVGASPEEPICFTANGDILQHIHIVQDSQAGASNWLLLPLDATVGDLIARLGSGRYEFKNDDNVIYDRRDNLLADYAISGDPIYVTKLHGAAAPKINLARAPSGNSIGSSGRPGSGNSEIACEVIFPDDSSQTVWVGQTASVRHVIDKLADTLNGRLPTVTTCDGDLCLRNVLVKLLDPPRKLFISFPDASPEPAVVSPPVDPETLRDPSITLMFYGRRCSLQFKPGETFGDLRTRFAPLVYSGEPPISFYCRQTELRDHVFLSTIPAGVPVTVEMAGPPDNIQYDTLPEMPVDYEVRLALLGEISGQERSRCRCVFNFHNFDIRSALFDLITPCNPG
jgi:hypothetical protein